MKKLDAMLIIIVFFLFIGCSSSDKNKTEAVISKDYSTITYNGDIYVPLQYNLLPEGIIFPNIYSISGVDATVEGENYFLDKFFTKS